MFSHTREHSSVVGIDWQNPDTCVPWRSSLNGRTRIQPSFPRALHLIVTMCCQHDSVLNQPRLRKQTSSNIPARILQQDMSNRKKSISVTSKLLSLILFSGLSRIIIFYSQFTKSKAFSGSLLCLGSKHLSSTCDSTTETLPLPSERKKQISIFRTGPMRTSLCCELLLLRRTPGLNQNPQ